MKTLKYILASAAIMGAVTASAQSADALRAAYFMDGYLFGHELNPSFAPEYDYAAIPILSNLNLGMQSNVGVNTFLYKVGPDNRLATFMHPDVAPGEFLNKLHNVNKLSENLSISIYSQGFQKWGGYNTIGLSIRESAGFSAPKDFFEFMKLGMTADETRYNFKNIGVSASAIAELAVGHSRQVLPSLRLGAKFKVLLGLGNVEARVTDMRVIMNDQQWLVSGRGHLNFAAGSKLKMPTNAQVGKHLDDPTRANQYCWDELKYDGFGLTGFGLGIDLGATWQVIPDLTLSVALRDISFMAWSNNHKGNISQTEWTFDGFKDIALDQDQPNYDENSLHQQFKDLGDQFVDCFNFQSGGKGSRTSGLGATFSLAAEYTLPWYRPLRGGFLFTQKINGLYSWTEGRFSATVRPVNWVEASISYGVSNFGSSFGWVLMFPVKGFNFFVGSDHQFGKLVPQGLPVGKANMSVSMGINIPFGKKHNHTLAAHFPMK